MLVVRAHPRLRAVLIIVTGENLRVGAAPRTAGLPRHAGVSLRYFGVPERDLCLLLLPPNSVTA